MSGNNKIAMAINYDYPDYGGMLQAYALYSVIKRMGYEPYAININLLNNDIRVKKCKYFLENIFDLSILQEKSKIVFKALRKNYDQQFAQNMSKRLEAFENFYKASFATTKAYVSWEELKNDCNNFSSIIVGSDQLWLPSNIAGDYYTLSFVPDDVNKIAYATSFGVSTLPDKQASQARIFLNRINYLSAREETGQKIIESLINKRVPLVCDPALLLSELDWDAIATKGRIIDEKYIFCYFMGDNPWQRKFVTELKAKTGCKVVGLLHLDQYIGNDEKYVDYAPYDVSPADFINLVKNAEFICTDSFHGTVFSIIYRKVFFTFMRFSDKATLSTNSRIDSLLKTLHLESQLVCSLYDLNRHISSSIDYGKITQVLGDFKNQSLDYLRRGLEKNDTEY